MTNSAGTKTSNQSNGLWRISLSNEFADIRPPDHLLPREPTSAEERAFLFDGHFVMVIVLRRLRSVDTQMRAILIWDLME